MTDEKILMKKLDEMVLKGYDFLKSRLDIPCCKETYYDLYRRFFWLLDRERK